jgi:nucleotide-binding universal stress UspA family protein
MRMGYKTISVIITDAANDAIALHAARAIAEREDGHLDVHCLGVDPTRFEPMPAGSAAIVLESGIAEAQEHADELVAWVASRLPDDMAKVSIHPVVIPQLGIDTLVSRLARYSDLIVATKPYGATRNPLLVTVLESELFGAGVPVLVVPPCPGTGDEPFRTVVAAWDESNESFNAIKAALPFLCAAEQVEVVMIDPPSHSPERSDPGGALSLLLSRHGVKTEVSVLSRTMPRVSDVLTRYAKEKGADLIVMGAYGHSRLREAIMGGATRDMLEASEIPLLMTR